MRHIECMSVDEILPLSEGVELNVVDLATMNVMDKVHTMLFLHPLLINGLM